MNKKNVFIAILLSSVFVIVWVLITQSFPQPEPGVNIPIETGNTDNQITENKTEAIADDFQKFEIGNITAKDDEEVSITEGTLETNKMAIKYTAKGGLIKSIQLKQSPELNNTTVNMIISGDSEKYPFGMTFGDFDTENVIFNVKKNSDKHQIEFSKEFVFREQDKTYEFILKKTFIFYEDEYLFDFNITLEGLQRDPLPLNFDNIMYTLNFGPQIGPEFEKLDSRNEYRRYVYFSDGKRKDYSSKVTNQKKLIDKTVGWIAIEGKYFIVIAYPSKAFLEPNTLGFDTRANETMKDVSIMFFNRPFNRSSVIEDKFKFYIGPIKKDILNQYKDRYHFDEAVPGSIWGWLIEILKFLLINLQKVVKNWGVAILLMTLIIKILLFPLTQKSFKSNTKMQALAPKVNEIKEKYKDDQQKQQVEMAALYKREGINPLGGCLPLLIQMPIFFALYELLNTHFELRGAVFIAGWINDLSLPEHFFSIPINIPFFGSGTETAIRLLPFIMLGTTFFQQRISQNPGSSTGQMKILLYAMPLFFFFIMYSMPSGLVIYWTMQNFLSVFQQIYINHVMKKGKTDTVGFMDKMKQLVRRRK